MQKAGDSASSLASDDSEPPEAVELTSNYEAPLEIQVASVPRICSAAEEEIKLQILPAPVTIITGCLGAGARLFGGLVNSSKTRCQSPHPLPCCAGKTTLVHKILTGDHGLKIAVFMNEFAEEQDLERQMLSRHEVMLLLQRHSTFESCLAHRRDSQCGSHTNRPRRERRCLLLRSGWSWQMAVCAVA